MNKVEFPALKYRVNLLYCLLLSYTLNSHFLPSVQFIIGRLSIIFLYLTYWLGVLFIFDLFLYIVFVYLLMRLLLLVFFSIFKHINIFRLFSQVRLQNVPQTALLKDDVNLLLINMIVVIVLLVLFSLLLTFNWLV